MQSNVGIFLCYCTILRKFEADKKELSGSWWCSSLFLRVLNLPAWFPSHRINAHNEIEIPNTISNADFHWAQNCYLTRRSNRETSFWTLTYDSMGWTSSWKCQVSQCQWIFLFSLWLRCVCFRVWSFRMRKKDFSDSIKRPTRFYSYKFHSSTESEIFVSFMKKKLFMGKFWGVGLDWMVQIWCCYIANRSKKKITFIIPELYYQYQDSNPMILILMKLHFHPSNFPQNLFWAFSAKPLYEFKFIPQNFKLKIKKTTKWFIRTTENLNHSHLIWNSSSFIIRMMGNFFYKLPGMLSHHRTRGKAWERCFLVLSFYSLP